MNPQIAPRDAQALRQLLRLPDTLTPDSRPAVSSLSMESLRQELGLPALAHTQILSDDCWLAGGRVLRWLCRREDQPGDVGDYDFFFPTLGALERTARQLLAQGYPFHRTLNQTRSFRGMVKAYIGDPEPAESVFGPNGDEFHLTGRRLWGGWMQYGLQFQSPQGGDILQLVHQPEAFTGGPLSVHTLMEGFDYTICQFAIDHRGLHAGTHAWADLLLSRLRRGTHPPQSPAYSTWRFHKYMRRGFRPYFGTTLKVYRGYLRYMAQSRWQRLRQLPA